MMQNKSLYIDHEYTIMQEIAENEKVTQRELSQRLGISLGTVNVLMNKMTRDGLIKMTQVSQKQVLYMLTPVGMMAKAKKTVSYLKAHYKVIENSRQIIKNVFMELNKQNRQIYLYIDDLDIREIIRMSIYELKCENVFIDYIFVDTLDEIELNCKEESILIYLKGKDIDNKVISSKKISKLNLLDYL